VVFVTFTTSFAKPQGVPPTPESLRAYHPENSPPRNEFHKFEFRGGLWAEEFGTDIGGKNIGVNPALDCKFRRETDFVTSC
jgi:hypothetical protein